MEVKTVQDLKLALSSDAKEIVVYDEELVSKLKVVSAIAKYGPYGIGAIVAAIPLVIATGPLGVAGMSSLSAVAASAGWGLSAGSIATLAGLVIAIGGTIAISLFTDWETVELPGGIKLTRKAK